MRHRWKVIILLLVLVALVVINDRFKLFAFHPFATRERGDFKVLCLNVHSTGEGFEERSIRIDSLIKAENPDFVFLTEYHDTCSMALDSLLRERYEFCQRGIGTYNNRTECVYSRWQIDTITSIQIDIESDKAKKYLEYTPSIEKHIAHSAILRCKLTKENRCISIYACHLASNNYLNEVDSLQYNLHKCLKGIEQRWIAYKNGGLLRELEAEAICNDISKPDAPVIVMGDMNDISNSTCLNLLEDCGLKDAWWLGGFGYGSTFQDGWLRLRIDHVMYSNQLDLTDVKVVDGDVSDHRPMTASFKIMK